MSRAKTWRSNTARQRTNTIAFPSWRPIWFGRRVAVIAVIGGAATLAAKAATTTIPIVFSVAEDPVRLGFVPSLARPGGNLTGINFFSAELAAKRLELLRELVPAAARVAVLVNPANATTTETTLRDVDAAARAIGLQSQVLNASTSREINAAFAGFVREVETVKRAACSSCEVIVLDMNDSGVAKRAKALGVRSVPAVAIDGKLAECCTGRGINVQVLRAAGLGVPL
jgi:hypothetical protein